MCEVHAPLLCHVTEHEVVLQHDVSVVVEEKETVDEENIDIRQDRNATHPRVVQRRHDH